jgi:hypothetical protein
MKPLLQILQFSFGCRHRHRSAVFTIKKRTYQVCLKCGQEFGYSWTLMHTTRSSVAESVQAPLPPNRIELNHIEPNNIRPNSVRPNNVRPNEAPLS